MENFLKAEDKAVRLKSHHNKFLLADSDQSTITQHGNGTSTAALWTVELLQNTPLIIRLKNLETKLYLSSSTDPFQPGISAKKASQALPSTDSVEWAPIKEGLGRVMLRSRPGTFLCANGSLLPWRNSVTHDMLCATQNIDWATWVVDVVEKDGSPVEEEELRRVCSLPVRSIAGISGSPMGSIGSVSSQGMDTIRRSSSTISSSKSTKVSKSFNSHEPIKVQKPLPLEVKRAKQTFMEVQGLDFKTVFFSERIRHVESSISILLSYTNLKNHSGSLKNVKLLSLQDQLQTLKSDQRRSTNELNEYAKFKENKADTKAELQRVVVRARELQHTEEEVHEALENASGERAELMRELERVERMMKIAEEDHGRNEAEIEELCMMIGRRSEVLKEMEREENLWMKRKVRAKRRIEQVEEQWDMIRSSFCC